MSNEAILLQRRAESAEDQNAVLLTEVNRLKRAIAESKIAISAALKHNTELLKLLKGGNE